MKIRINIDLKIGRVVKYLVFVDLMLLAGWGLIEPIFSIFIVDQIPGATLVTVGTAAGIYWLLKSLLQIPIAKYLDRKPGEKDDFYALILGLCIAAFAAFAFSAVQTTWQLYIAKMFQAVGFALYAATWPAIFSRHLDKDRVSFDWALDSTAVGISAGLSGFLGGVFASWLGFSSVFFLGATFTLASAGLLVLVPDLVLPPRTSSVELPKDHTTSPLGK